MKKIPQRDVEGRKLKVGDIVKIKGIPDTSSWTQSQKRFSLYVFKHLVGKYKRIFDFDKYGLAEIEFRMKKRGKWEYHTVWLEPYLLRLKQSRN